MKKTSNEMLLAETLYLVNLTAVGLKPLSRIEHPISNELQRYIEEQGLITEAIFQSVANGGMVEVRLLSKDQQKIREAKTLFDGKPVNLDAETIRSWGRVLGFPSCCVEFFVDEKTRHAPNNRSSDDQSILFHWACPDCPTTKKLIPAYREIWDKTQSQLNDFVQPPICES